MQFDREQTHHPMPAAETRKLREAGSGTGWSEVAPNHSPWPQVPCILAKA
jgi:hypothetical protein